MELKFPTLQTPEDSKFYQDFATIYRLDGLTSPLVYQFIQEGRQVFAETASGWLKYAPEQDDWQPLSEDHQQAFQAKAHLQHLPAPVPSTLNTAISVPNPAVLPDIRSATLDGDGTLWIGTGYGLYRRREGELRYFGGRRWLPDNAVTALLIDGQRDLWAGTDQGISRICSIPMTLEQKAAHYEAITSARHNRDGFVASCQLGIPGDLSTFHYEATDNDGLWTVLYLCAECFRWAVTGDPEAKALADRSLKAMLELVSVTGIPGFPARALIRQGEQVHQSDPGPNWYPSPLDTNILYKNDTSSDEIDGHYLAWYSYSEFVAGAVEKQIISQTCRAVTHHILDNNYTLVGPTGKPTRWGVWSPEKLNHDPAWRAERGLNSLEILSHLKVAIHLCGDARFQAAYHTLIEQHGYALNTVEQKITPPDGENNHSDDELAACAYYPLLQLETDPALRAIYLASLERTHAVLRPEGSPFYNFLYSVCTGEPCDKEISLRWLEEAPWDLRDWRMVNSHRPDVAINPERGRFDEVQLVQALSPAERRVTKWNSNPYQADGGTDGATEEDGAFWLLPYWMARYHGLLDA